MATEQAPLNQLLAENSYITNQWALNISNPWFANSPPVPTGSDIQPLSGWCKDDRLGPFGGWLAKIEFDPQNSYGNVSIQNPYWDAWKPFLITKTVYFIQNTLGGDYLLGLNVSDDRRDPSTPVVLEQFKGGFWAPQLWYFDSDPGQPPQDGARCIFSALTTASQALYLAPSGEVDGESESEQVILSTTPYKWMVKAGVFENDGLILTTGEFEWALGLQHGNYSLGDIHAKPGTSIVLSAQGVPGLSWSLYPLD
jgi:hypothetical protein